MNNNRQLLRLIIALFFFCGPMTANASVIYEYETLDGARSFIYESPDFFTANAVPALDSGLLSCLPAGCLSPRFYVDTSPLVLGGGDPWDAIGFELSPNITYSYFINGALGAFGTYLTASNNNAARLIVRPGPESIPEPATLALAVLGLAALMQFGRRSTNLPASPAGR